MKASRTILAALLLAGLCSAGPVRADWEPPLTVSQGNLVSDADMAVGPDGILHFAWSEFTASGGAHVYYSASSDQGGTWTPPVALDTSYSGWDRVWHPDVAVSADGTIHVANSWIHYMGAGRVSYRRSTDGGSTWENTGGWYSRFYDWPYLSAEPSGAVFLSWGNWIQTRLLFAPSADNGATWGPAVTAVAGARNPYGLGGYYAGEARTHAVDPGGAIHAIDSRSYARSADGGASWEPAVPWPASFEAVGIGAIRDELLVAGAILETPSSSYRPAYLRSSDGGSSWQGPTLVANLEGRISQIVGDGSGTLYTVVGNNPIHDQLFMKSSDAGATWDPPQSVPRGRIHELVLQDDGTLWAVGVDLAPPYWTGIAKYREPAGIDVPDFLSFWEKASFLYRFKVLGADTVELSFPADSVEIPAGTTVAAGGRQVPVAVTAEGDRILASFPADFAEWTECTLPISVVKGAVAKWGALAARTRQERAALADALASDDASAVLAAESTIQALEAENALAERRFTARILEQGRELASDATQAAIYESETAVYAHFKAGSRDGGAALVMLSSDSAAVGIGEPFRLEVKVTHLNGGETATVALGGEFRTLDVVESSETGHRKVTFDLFYPPSFMGASDVITVGVTVNGVVSEVPFTVNVR